MHRLRRMIATRPVGFSVLATVLFVVGVVLVAVAGAATGARLGVETIGAIGRVILIVPPLLLLRRLGWLRSAGIGAPRSPFAWLMTVPAFIYLLAVYPPLLTGRRGLNLADPRLSSAVGANGFAAGVLEEVVFRGLILHVLLRSGDSRLGRSVLISSALFSAPHALNILAGADPARVAAQLVWALLLGIAFASLALAGANVWPVAALHGILNSVVHLNALGTTVELTAHSAALLAVAPLPVNLYGILLLRRATATAHGPDLAGRS